MQLHNSKEKRGGNLVQLIVSDSLQTYHNPNWIEKIEEGVPVEKIVHDKIMYSESHDIALQVTR